VAGEYNDMSIITTPPFTKKVHLCDHTY